MPRIRLAYWLEIVIEILFDCLGYLLFGLICTFGEKIVEHLEQWYLMRKYKQIQEEKRKKRGKVSKRQRR